MNCNELIKIPNQKEFNLSMGTSHTERIHTKKNQHEFHTIKGRFGLFMCTVLELDYAWHLFEYSIIKQLVANYL